MGDWLRPGNHVERWRRAGRKANGKSTALPLHTVHLDRTTIHLNEFTHQRQADSRALMTARPDVVHPVESLKDARNLMRRNTDACIFNLKLNFAIDQAEIDRNLAGKRKFEGVGQ